MTAPPRGGRLPMLPVAPAIVVLISIVTAATIAAVAVGQLQAASDTEASQRSRALAAAIAARIRTAPVAQRDALLKWATERTEAKFVLVGPRGVLASNVSLAMAEVDALVGASEGETEVDGRRMKYASSKLNPPWSSLAVLALVEAPSPAEGTVRLSNAVAVLTLLLLGVAVVVTVIFTRTARDDVAFIGERIDQMAQAELGAEKLHQPVPLRSLDQIGLLTLALNQLIARFAEAEHGYNLDLNAAAQLDAERSVFLAGLSHELRTPLNAVLGFTHLLESEEEGSLSRDAKEALATIGTSATHLKALIDDILDLSAMETGQVRLTRVRVDVLGLAKEVVRECRATAKGRKIRFEVEGEPRAMAWADRRRVRQVLTNLVTNSTKATANGRIRVTVRHVENMIKVVVQDTGRGISPDVLSTIFRPYIQSGDARSRRGGSGLGLAITQRLVVLHGGTIHAQSRLGEGSRFTFTLQDESHIATVPRDSLLPWSERDVYAERERISERTTVS